MGRRTHFDDGAERARPPHDAAPVEEPVASTAAVLDVAGRAQQPGRGGDPAVGRAIDVLHASAGNGAIARLFEGVVARGHRDGTAQVRAGWTATTDRPVVQASPDDEQAVDGQPLTGDEAGAAMDSEAGTDAASPTDSTASALAAGAPPHGASWTKVGPPTNAAYSVSGSLREVANAVAARPEAGSVTATPSQDTETWTPDAGTEEVIAARVTVKQVLELPTWTDKTKATAKQQAEWDRFHGAITTHEAGHVTTDKTSFAGVHSKMVGQSPTQADAALDAAEAKAKTDNATYDTGNDHGLKQGTGINANIDEVTKVP